MSTRSNIIVGNQQFYHHWDGYPEGVGADLAYFLANINAGYLPAWNKSIEKLAEYLRYNGIPGRLASERGMDKAYEFEDEGLHGDIEFLYIVQGTQGNYRLYCVDVWEYCKSTPFEGNMWDHPFFGMKTKDLIKKFCKPEYEVNLPPADIPPEQRMYMSTGIFNHAEAKHCGMEKDIGYGEHDYGSGFVRIRNEKRRICPVCGNPIIGYPALSRRDGKTEICSACGEREAWEDYARARRFRR